MGYVNKWVRSENTNNSAEYIHTYNDDNRLDDFKQIKDEFIDESNEDLTFSDFVEDAKNLADNWSDSDENNLNQKRGKAFARKYTNFLVPITLLFVLVIALAICIVGFFCCGAAACCINGI